MGNLSEVKVGDYVYTDHINGGMTLHKIVRKTSNYLISDKDEKFRIRDGYKAGSHGSGRYGSFSTVYAYVYDDASKLTYNIQHVCRKLNWLHSQPVKVTENNYKEISSLLDKIIEIGIVKKV